MDVEFHEANGLPEVEEDALKIPRAKALCTAVRRHRDFQLIKVASGAVSGSASFETLVVEVECDGVPSRNPAGILYRERLAFRVPADPQDLPEVVALRKGFPVLIHQNQGLPDAPASLCVYFGPKAAVLRTWTPQSFLRRIQWWLEMSARGELHPADQPVEQLFFDSKCELVLPWNIDQLRSSAPHRLVISRGDARPDGGITCFVAAIPVGEHRKTQSVAHIELTLTPVVQGFIERDPPTLGILADTLLKRGADLPAQLRTALQQRIESSGQVTAQDSSFSVVLLHVPVCRSAGVEPEQTRPRAFMIPGGLLELGEALGAYFLLDGRYYSATGVLGERPQGNWRDKLVLPMEVLRRNTIADARLQSGIDDEGPIAVLVGAGSLGSAMLNLWGRSGWGRWSVIDNDHVKPHNLSRHVAFGTQIGDVKASVVAELHAGVMFGASEVRPIFADACDSSNGIVSDIIRSSELVVDASTTLEYPRVASTHEGLARHISVFITPSGNAAVMLAEDDKRAIRLRTLESQYYRALISQDWGSDHLAGNLGRFWSGAGCRDISMVLPYSRIMGHASSLAEQVRQASRLSDAVIRIWHRDPDTGAVAVHQIPALQECLLPLGVLSLSLDDGLHAKLRAMRSACLPNETGGILLGYYDFTVKSVVVVDALAAPPDSKGSQETFERGFAGLKDLVAEAARRTAGIVGYIGEWHSHPPGHSTAPSVDDSFQLVYLALGMAEDGLPVVQLIVGENDVRVRQAAVIT